MRCTRKAGNPFQTKQGNRLSCRDQERRRGSDEVVPGPLGNVDMMAGTPAVILYHEASFKIKATFRDGGIER